MEILKLIPMLVCLLVGLTIVMYVPASFFSELYKRSCWNKIKNWVPVDAEISNLQQKKALVGRPPRQTLYLYDMGIDYQTLTDPIYNRRLLFKTMSNSTTFVVGQTIPILYNPQIPTDIILGTIVEKYRLDDEKSRNKRLWITGIIFAIIMVLPLVLAIAHVPLGYADSPMILYMLYPMPLFVIWICAASVSTREIRTAMKVS